MTFGTDQETDREAAQTAAKLLSEWVEQRLDDGMHPAAVASALIGMGADLLAKATSLPYAARVVNGVAIDLARATNETNARPSTMN